MSEFLHITTSESFVCDCVSLCTYLCTAGMSVHLQLIALSCYIL